MTTSRKLAALLAAVALSITPAACGSDDDESPSDEPAATQTEQEALSPDAYIETVNKVQSEFASKAAKLNLASPGSPAAFKKSLDGLGVLLDTLIDDLDAAQPPEEVAAQHDELVGSLRDYGELVEANKEGLVSDDSARVSSSAAKIGEGSTKFSSSFDATIEEINTELGKE